MSISWLVEKPIAHRGYHNPSTKNYENSISAWRAAIDAGFTIECDLQITADGGVVVFHDSDLDRMTDQSGPVRHRTTGELAQIKLQDGSDTIRTLDEFLEEVDGKAPLLIELKGIVDEDAGLVEKVARSLASYKGEAAVMSFNHWVVAQFAETIPDRPRGLTAKGNENFYDFHMNAMKDHDLHFISYYIDDVPCRLITDIKRKGMPVISWTIRTPEQCKFSQQHADQITFEGFDPREVCPQKSNP
jgi:glycerophosphoryl diester phosphodiesterase